MGETWQQGLQGLWVLEGLGFHLGWCMALLSYQGLVTFANSRIVIVRVSNLPFSSESFASLRILSLWPKTLGWTRVYILLRCFTVVHTEAMNFRDDVLMILMYWCLMYIKGTGRSHLERYRDILHPHPLLRRFFPRYACFWGLIVGALFGSISLAGLAAIQKGSKSPPCIVSGQTDGQGFWVKGNSAWGMDESYQSVSRYAEGMICKYAEGILTAEANGIFQVFFFQKKFDGNMVLLRGEPKLIVILGSFWIYWLPKSTGSFPSIFFSFQIRHSFWVVSGGIWVLRRCGSCLLPFWSLPFIAFWHQKLLAGW